MSRIRTWALRALLITSAAIAPIMALACSGDDTDDAPLQIVVSTQVIADWVQQVGGDLVSVRALVPAGADAHTFEVTVDDIRAISEADLVVINGAGLESAYEEAVEENATNLLELADAVEAMGHELHPFEGMLGSDEEHHQEQQHEQDQQGQHHQEDEQHDQQQQHHQDEDQDDQQQHHQEEDQEEQQEHHQQDQQDHQQQQEHHQQEQGEQHGQEDAHGHDHSGEDPHFWFDADLAIASVTAIAEELIALAPDAEDDLNERLNSYIEEIESADEEIRSMLSDLSDSQRLLFTFHDAFGYFARRYGLTVAGFAVEGPEQGVSAEAIVESIELIEHEGVTTVFHEPQFDSSILDTLADETGVQRGIIYSQPTEDQPTYLDIMRANAAAIAGQ